MDEYRELYPELLAAARRMLEEGSDLEEILRALRQRCPSIIQSIKVVRDLKGMPLEGACSQ
jgi:fatty acid-binding protein DegV